MFDRVKFEFRHYGNLLVPHLVRQLLLLGIIFIIINGINSFICRHFAYHSAPGVLVATPAVAATVPAHQPPQFVVPPMPGPTPPYPQPQPPQPYPQPPINVIPVPPPPFNPTLGVPVAPYPMPPVIVGVPVNVPMPPPYVNETKVVGVPVHGGIPVPPNSLRFFGAVQSNMARNYILVVDKSGSMAGGRWREAKNAVAKIAPAACKGIFFWLPS
jgi:hypothetical protein